MWTILFEVWLFAKAPLCLGSAWLCLIFVRRITDALGDIMRSVRQIEDERVALALDEMMEEALRCKLRTDWSMA